MVTKPAPKRNLVGVVVPGLGTPLSVEGTLLLYGIVGTEVGEIVVADTVSVGVGERIEVGEGVPEVVGGLVGEGPLVGEGVILGEGVTVWPDGVAVNEGRSLLPSAKTVKMRVTFLTKPFWSV